MAGVSDSNKVLFNTLKNHFDSLSWWRQRWFYPSALGRALVQYDRDAPTTQQAFDVYHAFNQSYRFWQFFFTSLFDFSCSSLVNCFSNMQAVGLLTGDEAHQNFESILKLDNIEELSDAFDIIQTVNGLAGEAGKRHFSRLTSDQSINAALSIYVIKDLLNSLESDLILNEVLEKEDPRTAALGLKFLYEYNKIKANSEFYRNIAYNSGNNAGYIFDLFRKRLLSEETDPDYLNALAKHPKLYDLTNALCHPSYMKLNMSENLKVRFRKMTGNLFLQGQDINENLYDFIVGQDKNKPLSDFIFGKNETQLEVMELIDTLGNLGLLAEPAQCQHNINIVIEIVKRNIDKFELLCDVLEVAFEAEQEFTQDNFDWLVYYSMLDDICLPNVQLQEADAVVIDLSIRAVRKILLLHIGNPKAASQAILSYIQQQVNAHEASVVDNALAVVPQLPNRNAFFVVPERAAVVNVEEDSEVEDLEKEGLVKFFNAMHQ